MSEADELYRPGKHPKLRPEIMGPFVKANLSHPQMYGGMILRAGRQALDLMMAGKMNVSTFSRSLPDPKQIEVMAERAVDGHAHAMIAMPYLPNGGQKETEEGFMTPISMRGVWIRARRGVMKTIHSYALTALDLPIDAPASPASERVYMAKQLLKPENREAATVLQTMWQTADNAAVGRPIAESTAMLYRVFSTLPNNPRDRAAETAIATRAARAAFDGLIIPAVNALKPAVATVLGEIKAEDVVDIFPFDVIHEGTDEFTDADIAAIRVNGRRATEIYDDADC